MACLTIVEAVLLDRHFEFDVSAATDRRATMGFLKASSQKNRFLLVI